MLRCITLAALLSLLMFAPAWAERQATISVPESMPPMPQAERFPSLLNPAPVNGSWAVPDARPLGITLDNYSLTQDQIEAARRTGCRLVRLNIPMEHFLADADPDWSVLDQVISRLERAGMEVMPVLNADVPVPEFYREFCTSIAARYASSFRYYQLLDNINYKIGMNTKAYADLVSTARLAIVLNDADAEIVSGGIRGADLTYCEMLANQGALSGIDILAFNLFPSTGGIEGTESTIRREHCLPYMEDVVRWAQERGKRVWVSSFGVSTSYNWVGVDQPSQASMYARGALYLGWIGVERIIFTAIQDTDPNYQVPTQCCGLLDVSGMPKASYFALQSLNRAVDGAYHVQPPFLLQGFVYERPEVEDMVISPDDSVLPGGDQLAEFRVHDANVFGFWFYAQGPREYRFIYWLGRTPRNPTLITFNIGHIDLVPVDRYILLDNAPSAVNYQQAQNFLFVPYLPLEDVPGVIRFEVKEHGGAR